MRSLYALALLATAAAAAPLESVESGVYETPGTQAEIAARGKACIAQLVSNDAVQITGAEGKGFAATLADPLSTTTQQIPGGPVIVSADDSMIVANSRIPFKVWMSRGNIRSTLAFLAKDGRFKIRHSAIQSLTLDAGPIHNNGYTNIDERAPVAKRVRTALEEISGQIAACVQSAHSEDW